MSQSVGPVSIVWENGPIVVSAAPDSAQWRIEGLVDAPQLRGPSGAAWFNDDEWSGVETPSWLAWISNKGKSAAVWGLSPDLARRDALAVVIPAVLRREGFLDGHGAVVAPDPSRPDDGVFVTGLSGSGKSSLTVSSALGGARFLSDDSVAIGPDPSFLRAWSRRSSISLSPWMHARLVPGAAGQPFDDKIIFDAPATFPESCAVSLRVTAIVFLERGDASKLRTYAIMSTPAATYRSTAAHTNTQKNE